MIDHDRLFKELLTTFFVEFLELFLPDVAAYLERDSVQFLDKEVFTDVTAGERYEADLVVQARFQEEDSFFLIHLEHQAQNQPQFGKRMFRYFARLCEKHDLPVYPIALFSYNIPRRPEPNSYQVEFSNKVVLQFNYDVIQLNRLNWRDFVRNQNPVASALMAKMNIAPEERPRVKLECLRLLATLRLDPAKMQLISGFIDTYLQLNADEEALLRAEIARIEPAEQEAVMQIVTSWMREGIEQGLQQGRQEGLERGIQLGLQQGLQQGRREGESALILRLLTRRFGLIDFEIQDRIRQLSLPQLENLAEALLDFSDTTDLVSWLQRLSEPSNAGE
jgi:predicted transposase YdaD